jgi:predicted small metal-binding protein
MKTLHCRDAGFDCNHIIKANNEKEVMNKAAIHARKEHSVEAIDEEMAKKIKSLIRDSK